jgi:hypothetical protein
MLSVVIAGCANQKPPVAISQEADATKVRFVNRLDGAWIDLYPQTECNHGMNVITDNVFSNAVKSISEGAPKRLDMLDPPAPTDRNIAEYSFKPGQVMNIGIGGKVGGRCLGGVSFVTEPSVQYEVVLSGGSSQKCSLTVTTLESDGATVRRRPVRDLHPLVCKSALQ